MASSPVGFSSAGSSTGDARKLEHAYLILHEPGSALDKPGAEFKRVPFQFNPKELTIAKQATWARETARGSARSSPPQFRGPQPSKLSLEVFLDASMSHDTSVVGKVEDLMSCCTPTPGTASDPHKASPPWVLFRWGGLTGFLAYVSSVSAKYTLFTAAGLPIRAVCTVQLEELAGAPPKQNPTSGGLLPHRVHTVVEGDTLPAIAFREYGRAGAWRAVAGANRIDDPMRLPVGRTLLLPAAEELAREARDAAPAALSGRRQSVAAR